jgi:hypothetical protein
MKSRQQHIVQGRNTDGPLFPSIFIVISDRVKGSTERADHKQLYALAAQLVSFAFAF